MAQLPPKVPNVTSIWPEFTKLPHPYMAMAAAAGGGGNYNGNVNPSWVDEFLDFTSARRGAHRRSASDSIAFLEAPFLELGINATGEEFDRFDDDQLMSMFADEISPSVIVPTVSSSNPSSPSDHDSNNEDKQGTPPPLQQQLQPKNEPGEVQSPCGSDSPFKALNASGINNGAMNASTERIFDPKRVKRILANRQSAQRSRVRKLQYISELERSVNTLQAEVSVLSPRVAFLDHQRLLLNVDNSVLKQRIAAMAQDKIFKDAHQEALKKEIERLRQVYHHQQEMQKVDEEGGDKDNENVTCSSSDPDPPRLENNDQILSA